MLIFKSLANAFFRLFVGFATCVFLPDFVAFSKEISAVRRKCLNFYRLRRGARRCCRFVVDLQRFDNRHDMDNVEIFEVRECRDEYVAAVNRLLRQLDGESPEFTRDNLETIAGSEASSLFLLSCGGDIAGMASLCVYASPIGRKAWIEDVVVDSRFRGHSFGKFLVMHVLDSARRLGNITVMLTSRPSRIAANALYRSVGFDTKETNVYIKKF